MILSMHLLLFELVAEKFRFPPSVSIWLVPVGGPAESPLRSKGNEPQLTLKSLLNATSPAREKDTTRVL